VGEAFVRSVKFSGRGKSFAENAPKGFGQVALGSLSASTSLPLSKFGRSWAKQSKFPSGLFALNVGERFNLTMLPALIAVRL
jgi:hypothetical protein